MAGEPPDYQLPKQGHVALSGTNDRVLTEALTENGNTGSDVEKTKKPDDPTNNLFTSSSSDWSNNIFSENSRDDWSRRGDVRSGHFSKMNDLIKRIVMSCHDCQVSRMRLQRLSLEFAEADANQLPLPRQKYGIDFYGHAKGEILVAIDLVTRELCL